MSIIFGVSIDLTFSNRGPQRKGFGNMAGHLSSYVKLTIIVNGLCICMYPLEVTVSLRDNH